MAKHIEQIIVSIKLSDSSDARYTYTDPDTQEEFRNAKSCNLQLDHRTCVLFALDAESSKKGWTITQLLPNKTNEIDYELGPYNLSLGTLFKNSPNTDYKFFIVYYNFMTQETRFIDPQELNIPIK